MTLLTNTLDSLWQVVLVGLLLGAGLPALFALGVRSLASGRGVDSATETGPRPLGIAGAVVCFGIVLIAVVAGILLLTKDFLSSSLGIHVF
ncbi:hypothetical protein [Rhodococcus chondri]|uniref:DUF4190 domain-containing protein n=1 Tax=Rhodococcus chondri TaxID=3065941 RepID=A0ABU7JXJ1_9NOCA|nr:hypothetical protein [Rhodococcus sp. CC-R104]MEE2034507.1 hypothetical protein [Rhodococcus sp. CC-R104]